MDKEKRIIAVLGLGYVGLPVAVAFAHKYKVIGFDVKKERVEALKKGIDNTKEVSSDELKKIDAEFTYDPKQLAKANFFIVAVPTPIDKAKQPDLSLIKKASETLSVHLKAKDIVVYESTVYPGVTEDECIPLLEQGSGLKAGKDFFVGYSPERINPGDKEHCFTKIKKVVSAQTEAVLDEVANVYGSVVEAGVFKAASIKVAEAAKVIENAQRDINIAFMNELSVIFSEMGISTFDVLEAAKTKWNFLPFTPGLVGGHCIGVDPYYLTHLAETLDYHPEVIASGRRINDRMGRHIASKTVKALVATGKRIRKSKVGILGMSFKENCPDVRNTKVMDIISELDSYQIQSLVYDPVADKDDAYREYNVELSDLEALADVNAVIIAVKHDIFMTDKVMKFLKQCDLIVDVKNLLQDTAEFKKVIGL